MLPYRTVFKIYLLRKFFVCLFLFLMGTVFKVFIESVTILLLFYVLGLFGYEACRILVP